MNEEQQEFVESAAEMPGEELKWERSNNNMGSNQQHGESGM